MDAKNNDLSKGSFGIGLAVVGMEGRFPGSANLEEFWSSLKEGKEGISFLTKEELLDEGIDSNLIGRPDYVPARGVIEGIDKFDASFFGYSPQDASLMDPQQRFFLECSWKALENAGYGNIKNRPRTGVFASMSFNTYLLNNLLSNGAIQNSADRYRLQILSQVDSLATRTSYKLNLTGPSLTVQTACSSSLVALHLASQSLLNGECDLALVGAVSIRVPHKEGYLYQKEGIASPDGYCRPFDADAAGTVGGCGIGVVVLKRLEESRVDRDTIWGIVRGTAINNDGNYKVGFTAPSVDGQAEVIAEAMEIAECDFRSISYMEAHGTGTSLGDPIEVAALTKAHRTETKDTGYCFLGSVKSNIGHLDAAAGIAGLIKTLLAFKHEKIPPTLHTKSPNPRIDFSGSPFLLCPSSIPWKRNKRPRRAGVSSFGIGGTNAHVVLEEPPVNDVSFPSPRGSELILLSAKNEDSLNSSSKELSAFFGRDSSLNLADVSYTLSVGREPFDFRKAVVAENPTGAGQALSEDESDLVCFDISEASDHGVIFVFPGQGCQYLNMGKGLYEKELIFRQNLDSCADILSPVIGLDIRDLLFKVSSNNNSLGTLSETRFCQPVLFAIEYALAKLYFSWGVSPDAMIGHSLGEYVAACLAGVFSLEDALWIVTLRGQLMAKCPTGSMLAVACSVEDIESILPPVLDIASINPGGTCTLSGDSDSIEVFSRALVDAGKTCKKLDTSHAYHSRLMDSILDEFYQAVSSISLNSPRMPVVSSLTGAWLKEDNACNPAYWTRHIRETVHFAQGIEQLSRGPYSVIVEMGPRTLGGQIKRAWPKDKVMTVVASLRKEKEKTKDIAFLQRAIGAMWVRGIEINWDAYFSEEKRSRVAVPGYPFLDTSYWIECSNANRMADSFDAFPRKDAIKESKESNENELLIKLHPRPVMGDPYVEPKTEDEKEIARIWQNLLGISQIGTRDDFFELGGDSLTGVKLIALINEKFKINVSLDELYNNPTIERIAQSIEISNVVEDESELISLINEVEGLSDEETTKALSDEV